MSDPVDWATERSQLAKLPPEQREYYSHLLDRVQELEFWDPEYATRRLEEFRGVCLAASGAQPRRPLSYQGLDEVMESLRQQLTGSEFDLLKSENLESALPRARVWRKLSQLTQSKVSGTMSAWRPVSVAANSLDSKLSTQVRFIQSALHLIQSRQRSLALDLRRQFAQALGAKGKAQQQMLDKVETLCCKQLSRDDLQQLSEVRSP